MYLITCITFKLVKWIWGLQIRDSLFVNHCHHSGRIWRGLPEGFHSTFGKFWQIYFNVNLLLAVVSMCTCEYSFALLCKCFSALWALLEEYYTKATYYYYYYYYYYYIIIIIILYYIITIIIIIIIIIMKLNYTA